jgi:cytochrome c oxidase subunit III
MRHPYHLVDPSPWPLLISLSALTLALGVASSLGGGGGGTIVLAIPAVVGVAWGWWRDVIREGGYHTRLVRRGLTLGFLLFLASEVMLFFSFFWAYLHSALSPSPELGSVWPPAGVRGIDPWGIPLLGSLILLSSGFTVTVAHHAIRRGSKRVTVLGLGLTVLLGALFTGLQAFEYTTGEYTMSDSAFGSAFYMTTGLHGTHVIVGVAFLTACLVRLVRDRFSAERFLGLEYAILYWHLVDLVWLFVFTLFYWWGS